MTSWDDLTPTEKAAAKHLCERSHLYFSRLFFRELQGSPFRVGRHHPIMCRTIDDVLAGGMNRLIVSVGPGYTKTELFVVALIARGMAMSKGRARFIHASFSGELVNENSVRTKDVMASVPFHEMWGITFKDDQSAKGLWRTSAGGGMLAKPAGGPITGFRAGLMDEGFTGALVIDDPLKPDDAFSAVEREKINRRWHSTFKSRLAREDVPVVVIMQRLHQDDFAGYLLRGGADCKWHHLMLPAEIDNSLPYPDEYTHGIPIPHGLDDGPLWPEKHGPEHLKALASDKYTYASQYLQRPIALGGNLFKQEWFANEYDPDDPPAFSWRAIYADTAQKVGTKNDYSVLQCWGFGRDRRAYLIDQVRGKFEAPELLNTAIAFWNKHRALPSHIHGVLRSMKVEDKVSGTGLIQQLARKSVPVQAITRGPDQNKFTRAMDVAPSWAAGLVVLPRGLPWRAEFDREHLSFTGQGDTHDDQVDPGMDAVAEMCGVGVPLEAWV